MSSVAVALQKTNVIFPAAEMATSIAMDESVREKVINKMEAEAKVVETKIDMELEKEKAEKETSKKKEGDKERKGSQDSTDSQNGNSYRNWTTEIECFKDIDTLYIKQTNVGVNADDTSMFDVRNGNGDLVFKVIETINPEVRDQWELKKIKTKPPFSLSVFDIKAGREMLGIKGSLSHGVMLVFVKQPYHEDKMIGIIRRVKTRCCKCCCKCGAPCYYLERGNGSVLLKVKSSVRGRCCLFIQRYRKFRIYLADEMTRLGCVAVVHKEFDDEQGYNLASMGLKTTFPEDTTVTNKALILIGSLMVDYEYFQQARRPLKGPKVSRTCWIIITIVIVVIVIAILGVVFGGRGYQGGSSKGKGGRPGARPTG